MRVNAWKLGDSTGTHATICTVRVKSGDTIDPGDLVKLVARTAPNNVNQTEAATYTAKTEHIFGVATDEEDTLGFISVQYKGRVIANPNPSIFNAIKTAEPLDATPPTKGCCHPIVISKVAYEKADGTVGEGVELDFK